MPAKAPTSIGNTEYPQNIKIPANFTIPAGNVFKFQLSLAGFVWYICDTSSSDKWIEDQFRSVYFNSKDDISGFPVSPAAVLDVRNDQYHVLSAIPEHDTSSMIVTVINDAPSSDPTKNYPSELVSVISTAGVGAFSNITYLILTATDGGVPPPKSDCK
ncbi:5501_t:CDS:2 [Cetraspora pellucida]|uniref:5501_t:CDS:1 n=1 Tax=Cetraspora pellucida TaxID=1433469 RepID=A0A9N9EF29_9GLOM|nr:5501_t:CDS:2 [Cetraspora pellucida]